MLCKNYEGMILLRFPGLVLGFRVKGVGLTWGGGFRKEGTLREAKDT